MRKSGILLHITSLPGPYGVGTIGKAALSFVDFLKMAGQRYWQILPLNPTGFGDSPYQSCSTFAGNPYLNDLDLLVEQGLLRTVEICALPWGENPTKVDYGVLYQQRQKILRIAFERFSENGDHGLLRAPVGHTGKPRRVFRHAHVAPENIRNFISPLRRRNSARL